MPIAAESLLPLVQAARRQDSPAWDRLLKEHQTPLYVYIAELIRNQSDALDLAQETFASAVRNIGGLRDDRKFSSWLFSIAHQKCLQYWRSRQRDNGVFSAPEDDPQPDQESTEADDPRALLIRKERAEALLDLVDRLPTVQRSVFLLRILEGFSLQEIAEITEAPLGTVKSRLHHATAAVRELVGQSEGAPPFSA